MSKEEKTIIENTEVKEAMIPISDVKKLIAEAIENSKKSEAPVKLKKILEHTPHLWRFDGKWVVDFVNQNKDSYIKKQIHTFQKFSQEKREFETWIDLVFHDGTNKEVFLPNYVNSDNRMPIYCKILKKEVIDTSYSIGEIEKKDWKNDQKVGTGVMVDQVVEQYEEIFTLQTPEGEEITVPSYALC